MSEYPLNSERLETWAIDMAKHVAKLSKDPSTKVGAILFDHKRRFVSAGYNGLPRGVQDTPERLADRDTKYKMIRHAEANAIAFATASLDGATLVVTHPCCAQCAGAAIQAGIAHVVWPSPEPAFLGRWGADLRLVLEMFQEAGVEIHEV
jgi:dCMP deaminase